jgi:hypothetical protein
VVIATFSRNVRLWVRKSQGVGENNAGQAHLTCSDMYIKMIQLCMAVHNLTKQQINKKLLTMTLKRQLCRDKM